MKTKETPSQTIKRISCILVGMAQKAQKKYPKKVEVFRKMEQDCKCKCNGDC